VVKKTWDRSLSSLDQRRGGVSLDPPQRGQYPVHYYSPLSTLFLYSGGGADWPNYRCRYLTSPSIPFLRGGRQEEGAPEGLQFPLYRSRQLADGSEGLLVVSAKITCADSSPLLFFYRVSVTWSVGNYRTKEKVGVPSPDVQAPKSEVPAKT